jgi:DNA-binding LacI/PurR family transcriptional regulator
MSKHKCSNKVERVSRGLLELARTRGPGIKLPTFQELCRQFSVSRTTLERALEPLERRGLLSRRQGSGIYVEPAIRLKTVGVAFGGDIFGEQFSPFWRLLLESSRAQVGQRPLTARAYLDVENTKGGLGGHTQLLEDLEFRRLDGLLIFAPPSDTEIGRWLDGFGVPRVSLGAWGSPWHVLFDVRRFARLAAEVLAGRPLRRIALLGHGIMSDQALIAESLHAVGLGDVELDDWSYETWSPRIPEAGSHEHCAYETARRRIADRALTPLPDAIISMEDTMTRGVSFALQEAGLQPGGDRPIVTIENRGSMVLCPFAPRLNRVVFDPAAIVKAALDMLECLMEGGTPERNPTWIPPEGLLPAEP